MADWAGSEKLSDVDANKLERGWLDANTADDRARWDDLILRLRHDFHQLPAYVQLEAVRLGGRGHAVFVRDPDAGHEALLPLILRPLPSGDGVDAVSPYGYPSPVFSTTEPAFNPNPAASRPARCAGGPAGRSDSDLRFMAACVGVFVEALRERGVASAFVRLHPLLDAPEAAMAEVGTLVEHGPTVWIDLEADEAAQWAGYRATHRNLIRRAKREGQRVVFDDEFARLDEFFAIYAQTMLRVDADWAEFGLDYLRELAEVLRGRGYLALVEHDNQVIGGGIFTSVSGIVQYHLSGTANAWLQASPNRLMLDEVRRRQAARGDWRMHLGGGVGAREDALFQFKRGFSPQRGRFLSWRLIGDERAYARECESWRARGGVADLAGAFFPLYRAPIQESNP